MRLQQEEVFLIFKPSLSMGSYGWFEQQPLSNYFFSLAFRIGVGISVMCELHCSCPYPDCIKNEATAGRCA